MEELLSLVVVTLSFLLPFLYLLRNSERRTGNQRPERMEAQSRQQSASRPSVSDRLREMLQIDRLFQEEPAAERADMNAGQEIGEAEATRQAPERRLIRVTAVEPAARPPDYAITVVRAPKPGPRRTSGIGRIRRLPPLQQALVMAEVLGPPRALKEFPEER